MTAGRRLASRSPISELNARAPISSLDAGSETTMTISVSQDKHPRVGRSMPAHDEILSQVERILTGDAFDASERNRTFLRYVVEETLAGRSEYIKGYTVALKVFNRDSDFDPQLDPVVRIEASRLRRSLERYYFTAGKFDRIRVELPKGGYVPRFEVNEDCAPILDPVAIPRQAQEASTAASAPRYSGPAVVVLGFENLSGSPNRNDIARAITEELVGRLTRCPDLVIFASNIGIGLAAIQDPPEGGRGLALGYMLKGSVQTRGSRLRISVQLLDLPDGRFLWAEKFDYERGTKDTWALQERIAETIATCIAAPHGAIRRLASERTLQERTSCLPG
jgi:adenylate cyclase